MLVAAGTAVVDAVILVSTIVPVGGMIWFAWWFLRAGKRYDERERAAGRAARSRPPEDPFAR